MGDNERMVVRVLAGMAAVVTLGWFITFVILPAVRPPEYRPAPEVSMLTGTIFTGLAGTLTALAIKARRPRDDDEGGRNPPNDTDDDTESGDHDAGT